MRKEQKKYQKKSKMVKLKTRDSKRHTEHVGRFFEKGERQRET